MTMMAPTEEDAMFELELRILPQDGKDRYSLNGPYTTGPECSVHASGVTIITQVVPRTRVEEDQATVCP